MKLAFLIGSDTYSTRLSIDAVCQVRGTKPVAILIDTASVPFSRRLKNLKRNIHREGLAYLFYRTLLALQDTLEKPAKRIMHKENVNNLLQKAFPERSFTVRDLEKRYGLTVLEVGNLNSSKASALLHKSGADLGIVIGTRILKRATFSVPPLGCINLHKGKVPEFRGSTPGFWELYEGAKTAGVTVHFVDDGLDTGDIIGTSEVAIHENETVLSLKTKLDLEGTTLLAKCVTELVSGTALRSPQPESNIVPKTNPTRQQRLKLKRSAPHSISEQQYVKRIVKTLIYLGFYYLGIYKMVRLIKHKAGVSRAKIILYHRVNDYSVDALSTSTESFAEHLLLLKQYYRVRSTSWLVERLQKKEPIPPDTIVIHFDDCYKDVYIQAAPLLVAAELPATAFISSGYIDSSRAFSHDVEKYPFMYENMTQEEIRGLLDRGFKIGAHTVNHTNLGVVSLEQVKQEVLGSRAALEEIIRQPVEFFSFPFGKLPNINEKAREIIRNAGFKALFSTYGGVVTNNCSLFDIPRGGVYSEHRPLDFMMEIESLSLRDFACYLTPWRKHD